MGGGFVLRRQDFVLMCVEVKSDYQKPSWLKSLFRAV